MKLPRSMGVVGNVRYGFQVGRTTVKLWSCGDGLPTWTGAPARRTGIRVMTAFVEDVAAPHRELEALGAPIKAPPSDIGTIARVMFVADPDGNWIEFATPLG